MNSTVKNTERMAFELGGRVSVAFLQAENGAKAFL